MVGVVAKPVTALLDVVARATHALAIATSDRGCKRTFACVFLPLLLLCFDGCVRVFVCQCANAGGGHA